MRNLTEQLSMYAAYHRDRRNIATHFVGIPMIVFGIATLLARPTFNVAGISLAPVYLVTLGSLGFYFALDLAYGAAMTVFMGLAVAAGVTLAAQSTTVWLSAGLGLFVLGWAIQFVGHIFEGRKPAFVDDIVGLLVGPLFIVAEWSFLLGMRHDLLHTIEERVGPTRASRASSPASA